MNIVHSMSLFSVCRAFNSPKRCVRCERDLDPSELVIRVKDGLLLYHVGCFTCGECGRVLSTGDLFGLYSRAIYCKEHHETLARTLALRSGPPSDDSNNNKQADKGSFFLFYSFSILNFSSTLDDFLA